MFAPLQDAPLAYTLLLILFLVGLLGFAYPDLISRFKFYPYAVARAKRLEGVFTSLFFHDGWMHLCTNLIFAVFFLPEVEYMLVDDFGRPYGSILLICTVAGIALFAGITTAFRYRDQIGFSSLGFSAVLFGIAVFFYFYLPVERSEDGGIITGILHGYQIGAFGFIALYMFVRYRVGKAAKPHLYGALGGLVLAIIIRPLLIMEVLGHMTGSRL